MAWTAGPWRQLNSSGVWVWSLENRPEIAPLPGQQGHVELVKVRVDHSNRYVQDIWWVSSIDPSVGGSWAWVPDGKVWEYVPPGEEGVLARAGLGVFGYYRLVDAS